MDSGESESTMEEEHYADASISARQNLAARSFSSTEPAGALIDLARLARKAGAVRTEQEEQAIAAALLSHLLSLCAAHRGAVLLVRAQPASSVLTQVAANPLRILACQGMHEHEVVALAPMLLAMPADLSTIQGGSAVSCWLLYHCPYVGPVTDHPAQERQQAVSEPDVPAAQAYVLLRWDSVDGLQNTQVMGQSRQILLLLADALAAVFSNLRQAARLEALEIQGGKAMHNTALLSPELLATVSHELRSPLTAIKGYATTLLRSSTRLSREERSQFLLAISEASDRLDQLVGRLLELAELENGLITFTPMPIDMARLVEEALLSAERRADRQAPARFTFRLCLQTPENQEARSVPIIWGDPRLLREALDNLLENAIKYSPEGGMITVRLRPITNEPLILATEAPNPVGEPVARVGERIASPVQDQPAALLEMSVCDQGIGMTADHIERVFERFYQVDRSLTREVSGVGLGLAICKQIVELHHGRIWVESRPGEGSTFHFVIPIPERHALEQFQASN